MNTEENGYDLITKTSALMEKLHMVVDTFDLKVDAKIAEMQSANLAEIKEINRKLFDGITKKELVEGIVDNDVLSFKGLLERPDVQLAISESTILHAMNMDMVMGMGSKIQTLEGDIRKSIREIELDIIIQGCTKAIAYRIEVLENTMKSQVASM